MKLPEWTVLPVLVGFFSLILFDPGFIGFIAGYKTTPDNEIDVTRLILNCFMIGIAPTLATFNTISILEERNKFRFWIESLSDNRRQLFLIAFAVFYGFGTVKIVDNVLGKDRPRRFAYMIAKPYRQKADTTESDLKIIAIEADGIASDIELASKKKPKLGATAKNIRTLSDEIFDATEKIISINKSDERFSKDKVLEVQTLIKSIKLNVELMREQSHEKFENSSKKTKDLKQNR